MLRKWWSISSLEICGANAHVRDPPAKYYKVKTYSKSPLEQFTSRAFVCGLSSPVVGLHSVGRLTSGRFCRVCLGTGDFLRPQGAIPQAFTPFGGGGYCLAPEAPQKGECRRGRRYFGPCRTRVGFGPATGLDLKTALCHIRALVGRIDKYQNSSLLAGARWIQLCLEIS